MKITAGCSAAARRGDFGPDENEESRREFELNIPVTQLRATGADEQAGRVPRGTRTPGWVHYAGG